MNDYEEIYGIPKWHGAEAKIYIIDYKDTKAIFKHRLSKEYRHSSLDREIRITRHRQVCCCFSFCFYFYFCFHLDLISILSLISSFHFIF